MEPESRSAPMSAAPMQYHPDGSVAWGEMWESFCIPAIEGGPPHRDTMIEAPANPDPNDPAYQQAVAEIIRGLSEVCQLQAHANEPGWVSFSCPDRGMASWLADAIPMERVSARRQGRHILVPVDATFSLKGEIKSVITAVAKTSHYWSDHLSVDVKRALATQEYLQELGDRIRGWFRPR